MSDFLKRLQEPRILFFDGGMGTMLQAKGMPSGISPEHFGMERPDIVAEIHEAYLRAGAEVVTTNTFQGSRYKLGPETDVRVLNKTMAEAAKAATARITDRPTWVAGSVGPTGLFVRPLGPLDFQELLEAYMEQVRGLEQGGADLIMVETMFDLAEVKAAVMAAKMATDLPVAASMSFEQGRSLTGSTPAVFADTVQNLGVDLVGTNCSAGPEGFVEVLEAMRPRLDRPLFMQPNAGLPILELGQTVFKLEPEPFAEQTGRLAELGAYALGGCCGTTPAHIKALRERLEGFTPLAPAPEVKDCLSLTSRSVSVTLSSRGELPMAVIGERINPTGKKQLTEELQAGEFTRALSMAREQLDAGARILDVNVGAPMVDEAALLPALTELLVSRFESPLSLDTTVPEAMEAALALCPGSPLVNSISGEPGRMERLGPVCRDHGAPFILLPLKGKKLPVTAKDRIGVIEELYRRALDLGVPKRLIMVDVLALTVSSKPEAGKSLLETIRYCSQDLGLPTVFGLSNISFGLPARELINSTFLAMAMAAGLSSCIANPGSSRLIQAASAAEVLLARDAQAENYVGRFSQWKPGTDSMGRDAGKKEKATTLEQAVITGDKEGVAALVEQALDNGEKPFDLVNKVLIPAITTVGEKYERKEYFLPQLILSAETVQLAFERLKPLLEAENRGEDKPVVVMATVEGDVHDIGKNIVNLILRNHGFEVVDLGKDVPAENIVDAAVERGASLIGLSALMTTTMVRMEDTVKLVRARNLPIKVMLGGAVVSSEFADSIGADGYAEDAVTAVRLARRLLDGLEKSA